MITWNAFLPFAAGSLAFGLAGAWAALRQKRRAALWLSALAFAVLGAFIGLLWGSLGRPPLRTMGETRLWYSFFMLLMGCLVYWRWRLGWIPLFSLVVAGVFAVINLLRPEIHDQSLMPALQSPWFVPHVTVYMFSYSVFGCAFLLAIASLWHGERTLLPAADRLVSIGLCLLTLGMLSGCLWAKEAWGHYWSWDPKETWAAATWCSYLVYLHLRLLPAPPAPGLDRRDRLACVCLIASFALLQMCWYGVNYLPGAAESMHSYAG